MIMLIVAFMQCSQFNRRFGCGSMFSASALRHVAITLSLKASCEEIWLKGQDIDYTPLNQARVITAFSGLCTKTYKRYRNIAK